MSKYKYIAHLENKKQELHKRRQELEDSIQYNSSTLGDAVVSDGISYAKDKLWKKVVKSVTDYFSKEE